MNLSSPLCLSHMGFAHWHTDDTEVGIVVAKEAFVLTPEGTQTVKPPPELHLVDVFAGDPATSPLLFEQDIAPGKPKTDLILRGMARSLDARPRRDWPVSVHITDVLTYGFHVRGPTVWHRERKRWQQSAPDQVTEVPLTYGLAYGGSYAQGEEVHFFEQNPAGIGFMAEAAAPEEGWAAPQIGLLAEFMAAKPFAPMSVHGTMPIAKAWLPRRSVAGTFDAAWERDRHPRMPLDYDLGFWNAAPMRLQIGPRLEGHETVEITGLSHSTETVVLHLPGAGMVLASRVAPATEVMGLDTVDIDMSAVDDGQVTITLVWRAIVADRDLFARAEIVRGAA